MPAPLTEVTVLRFLILVFLVRNHFLYPLSPLPISAAPVSIGGCGSEAISSLLGPLGSLQEPQEPIVGKSLGMFAFE